MRARQYSRFMGAFGTVLVALAVGGCAVLGPTTPEKTVEVRAKQRWDALMAKKWSVAYNNFMSPAYRAVVSEDLYAEQYIGVPKWKNVEVLGVTCEPEKCETKVRIFVEMMGRGGLNALSTDIQETWLLEDGQWYKYEKF